MDEPGNQPVDDFTMLPGIGEVINRRLHDAGVDSFRALSRLDVDRLAELLVGVPSLSACRLSNADWIGRAAQLARSTEVAGEGAQEVVGHPPSGAGPEATPTYESFVLCVVSGAPGQVPRVRLQHVRTGAVRHTAAGLDELPRMITAMLAAEPRNDDAAGPDADLFPSESTAVPPEDIRRNAALAPVARLAVQPSSKVVRAGDPLTIEVRIGGLTSVDSAGEPIRYAASVAARPLGRARRSSVIARGGGRLPPDLAITLPAQALDVGTYWLEAVIELPSPGDDLVMAFAESMLTVCPAGEDGSGGARSVRVSKRGDPGAS